MFKSSALAGGFFVYIAKGKFVGLGVGLHLNMGRGEFFRLRRSAKWPPRLFLRAKVVRRLTRRSNIGSPCWISLSASPAGGRFASAGEKSHLFLRYCLPANSRCGHSASAGENHPPSLGTARPIKKTRLWAVSFLLSGVYLLARRSRARWAISLRWKASWKVMALTPL